MVTFSLSFQLIVQPTSCYALRPAYLNSPNGLKHKRRPVAAISPPVTGDRRASEPARKLAESLLPRSLAPSRLSSWLPKLDQSARDTHAHSFARIILGNTRFIPFGDRSGGSARERWRANLLIASFDLKRRLRIAQAGESTFCEAERDARAGSCGRCAREHSPLAHTHQRAGNCARRERNELAAINGSARRALQGRRALIHFPRTDAAPSPLVAPTRHKFVWPLPDNDDDDQEHAT